MNAKQYLNTALGGNMNISTLKQKAWHGIMEDYAQHKTVELKNQLEKAMCCGSCQWCDDHEDPICINRNSDSFGHSKFIRECCGKWEVRE